MEEISGDNKKPVKNELIEEKEEKKRRLKIILMRLPNQATAVTMGTAKK